MDFHTTYSGTLTVKLNADSSVPQQLEMDFPNEYPEAECPDWASNGSALLQAILGKSSDLEVEHVFLNTRLRYLLIKLAKGVSREQLESFKPDGNACLAAVPTEKILLAIVTTECITGEYDFLSRVFCPWSGIPEDPVTGSAHAVLGPWWAERLNKTVLRARQCSPRGGDVTVAVDSNGKRVKISGDTAIVFKGSLYLPALT